MLYERESQIAIDYSRLEKKLKEVRTSVHNSYGGKGWAYNNRNALPLPTSFYYEVTHVMIVACTSLGFEREQCWTCVLGLPYFSCYHHCFCLHILHLVPVLF